MTSWDYLVLVIVAAIGFYKGMEALGEGIASFGENLANGLKNFNKDEGE